MQIDQTAQERAGAIQFGAQTGIGRGRGQVEQDALELVAVDLGLDVGRLLKIVAQGIAERVQWLAQDVVGLAAQHADAPGRF